jgi:acyl-CoA thioester hydrolase
MATVPAARDRRPHRHDIRVRYGEVDIQGVVFNAHYLAYCDDASDTWFRSLAWKPAEHGWDVVVKRVVLEWQGPAGLGEVISIAVEVVRWGTTSFDGGFTGAVADRPVFTATITYVGVDYGTQQPTSVPDSFRAAATARAPAGGDGGPSS